MAELVVRFIIEVVEFQEYAMDRHNIWNLSVVWAFCTIRESFTGCFETFRVRETVCSFATGRGTVRYISDYRLRVTVRLEDVH